MILPWLLFKIVNFASSCSFFLLELGISANISGSALTALRDRISIFPMTRNEDCRELCKLNLSEGSDISKHGAWKLALIFCANAPTAHWRNSYKKFVSYNLFSVFILYW